MNEVASPVLPDRRDFTYPSANALLIVADSPAAFARVNAAAIAAGMPVYANVGLEDALRELARLPPWMVLELDEPPVDGARIALDAVLTRVAADTQAGRYTAILSTPAALIDIVAPYVTNERVEQLADASPADRVSALLQSDRLGRTVVRERTGEGGDAVRLRALSQEVERIAGALARLTAVVPAGAGAVLLAANHPDADDLAELARIHRVRSMRARFFEPALFADPAWDMLLDLAAAHIAGKPVAVSSLCIAAAVPPTTALRWIKMLTDAGLFVRRADPTDGRRVFVELGVDAAAAMRAYLADIRLATVRRDQAALSMPSSASFR